MQIEAVRLVHFRNYRLAEVSLDPAVVLLHGGNGQGKSNFLEALYVAANLRSFRTHRLDRLVYWGCAESEVRLSVRTSAGRETLAARLTPGGRRLFVDDQEISRPMDYLRRIRVIALSPDDLFLLRDQPEERRRFLDRAIFHTQPAYGPALTEFGRVLRHRNALLRSLSERSRPGGTAELDAWDEGLVGWGAEIRSARAAYLCGLTPGLNHLWRDLLGQASAITVSIREAGSGADPATLLETLRRRRASDLARGFTGCGPHRDDVDWSVDGRPAREFFSQGQFRLFVLTLKLAEAALHFQSTGIRPVLLLDDVTAELDADHRDRLEACLTRAGQIIGASCDAAAWPRAAGRIRVQAGALIPEHPAPLTACAPR